MTEQGLRGCWELVRQWRRGRPSSQGQDTQDNFKKEESFKCLSPEAPQCSFCGPESSSSLSDLVPLRGPIFLCFPVTPPRDPSPQPRELWPALPPSCRPETTGRAGGRVAAQVRRRPVREEEAGHFGEQLGECPLEAQVQLRPTYPLFRESMSDGLMETDI